MIYMILNDYVLWIIKDEKQGKYVKLCIESYTRHTTVATKAKLSLHKYYSAKNLQEYFSVENQNLMLKMNHRPCNLYIPPLTLP